MPIPQSRASRGPFAWVPVALACLLPVAVASLAEASGPDGVWARLAPHARWSHAMVVDPVRDRLVSVGGWDGVRNTNDVRVLNLADPKGWTPFATAGPLPPVRSRHTMVYDSARDRVIVFGGWGQHPIGNDTWALPLGGDPVWTRIEPPGPLPEGRMEHCAIYDPVRDRMLVFGGVAMAGTVWALALSGEPAWSPLAVSGDVPIVREGSSAVYDPVGDRMLLFGGADNGGNLYNLVWQLTLGAHPTWSLVPFGPVYPAARFAHTAVYDAEDHRMVIFGGRDEAGVRNDAWALYLTGVPSWGSLGVTPPAVSARQWHTAAWDAARDRMLVAGGWSATGPLGDVRALDLAGVTGWTTLDVGGTPPPRAWPVAVLDTRRDRMLVFGGDALAFNADVWAVPVVGTPRWEKLAPIGTPGGRIATSAIYDPARDRVIVFGGQDENTIRNDAWALELGAVPRWEPVATSGGPPPARAMHTAVHDAAGDRMVVFGGIGGLGVRVDTWALSLEPPCTWTALPDGPSSYGHAAVLDASRNRMLVFGGAGYQFSALTWALSLGASPAWSQVPASGAFPPALMGAVAVFDDARDRLVVHGGWNGANEWGEAWALDFGGPSPVWSMLNPPWAWPPGRWKHAGVFDPLGDRLIVFGGEDDGVALGDLWALGWGDALDAPAATGPAAALALAPPWPNPAHADVRLAFTIPRAARASLVVHDLAGRVVRTLADAAFEAGRHLLAWDRRDAHGRAVPGGIYFASLATDAGRVTRKFVVVP